MIYLYQLLDIKFYHSTRLVISLNRNFVINVNETSLYCYLSSSWFNNVNKISSFIRNKKYLRAQEDMKKKT